MLFTPTLLIRDIRSRDSACKLSGFVSKTLLIRAICSFHAERHKRFCMANTSSKVSYMSLSSIPWIEASMIGKNTHTHQTLPLSSHRYFYLPNFGKFALRFFFFERQVSRFYLSRNSKQLRKTSSRKLFNRLSFFAVPLSAVVSAVVRLLL